MSARGTVDFVFKGQELKLRPDQEAIGEIEITLDKSIAYLGHLATTGRGTQFGDLKTIIWAGMRGYYRDIEQIFKCPSLQEVGDELFRLGITNHVTITAASRILFFAITTEDEIENVQTIQKKTEEE